MTSGALVDTIIQGAAVDLFHSYSIALAPVAHTHRPGSVPLPDVAAFIDFDAPSFTGTLYLCCPSDLAPQGSNANRKATAEDWVRELANQLLGRIKKRLLQSDLNLKAGLPKTGNSQLIQRHFARVKNPKLYEFRTLRGPVVLLIDGTVSDSVVNYSGSATDASEGDIILFESEASVE